MPWLRQTVEDASNVPATGWPLVSTLTLTSSPSIALTTMRFCGVTCWPPFGVMTMLTAGVVGEGLEEAP